MAMRIPISAGGRSGELTALVGTVIGTERSSDTRVSGSGYATSVNGQVFGRTDITTGITVRRDIWLRDAEGLEHHKRLNIDLPVRVGQCLAFIDYEGETQSGRRNFKMEMGVKNFSTGKYHEVNSPRLLWDVMAHRISADFLPVKALAVSFSVLLRFLDGFGPLRTTSLGPTKDEAVRVTVEERFQEMVALVDAAAAHLAPVPETTTVTRLQSGPAD